MTKNIPKQQDNRKLYLFFNHGMVILAIKCKMRRQRTWNGSPAKGSSAKETVLKGSLLKGSSELKGSGVSADYKINYPLNSTQDW